MEPGTEFRLEYKSLAVNTVPGLSDDGSGLKFRMTLVFTSVDDCWLVLKVGCTMGLNTWVAKLKLQMAYVVAILLSVGHSILLSVGHSSPK